MSKFCVFYARFMKNVECERSLRMCRDEGKGEMWKYLCENAQMYVCILYEVQKCFNSAYICAHTHNTIGISNATRIFQQTRAQATSWTPFEFLRTHKTNRRRLTKKLCTYELVFLWMKNAKRTSRAYFLRKISLSVSVYLVHDTNLNNKKFNVTLWPFSQKYKTGARGGGLEPSDEEVCRISVNNKNWLRTDMRFFLYLFMCFFFIDLPNSIKDKAIKRRYYTDFYGRFSPDPTIDKR